MSALADSTSGTAANWSGDRAMDGDAARSHRYFMNGEGHDESGLGNEAAPGAVARHTGILVDRARRRRARSDLDGNPVKDVL